MSQDQNRVVSQKQEKVLNDNKQVREKKQEKGQMEQEQMNEFVQQLDAVTTNHIDLMSSRSDGQRTLSRMSQCIYEQIIPLSHQKRQKSFSPIKRQKSILIEQNHSVTFMRRNTTNKTININTQKQQQPANYFKTQNKQSLPHFEPQKSQTQSIIHASLKQTKQNSIKSSRKNQPRRTQIFSSDKKHTQKNLKLNTNTVAEQIFNLNKKQRIHRHQIYQQLQRENLTPSNKSKREDSLSLSRSKKNQIKKLQVISASPLKATQQYWEGIYPQSKRYINSLKQTLYEEKQILKKWQSGLQASLRQNLYQVEEILLQKLYEISRQCVKLWVHQQLQNLQKLWIEDFRFVKETQKDIQRNEIKLQEYQRLLQNLNRNFKQSKQSSKSFSLFQKGIYSIEFNKAIAETSQKVKQVVSKSQQLAHNICQGKISKANRLNDSLLIKDQDRLDKVIKNTLNILFNPVKKIMTPKKQSQKLFEKKGFDIGQKIKMILNRSQQKEPQTMRQQIVKQFQYSDKFVPYSHRKSQQTPVIKNNQKDFQQFKYEFQNRKRNFIDQSNITQSDTKKISHFEKPISQKSNQKTTFDQKINNLFKKITQQKQQPQDTNRSSIQTNYFNEYNDLIKKKKQQNRQNFFRYSIQ